QELRKRAAKLGVKYVHLTSPELEKARNYLINHFNTVFGEAPLTLGYISREQLANKDYMREQVILLTEQLNNHYGYNYTTIKALRRLLDQILRLGSQFEELGTMSNQLVTNDYVQIKELGYSDCIFSLSQREDDLGLKPGTLLNTAMATINQLFLAIALELDMPFANKIELFNEDRFLNILIKKTKHTLEELTQEHKAKSEDVDLPLKIVLKQDKLVFLINLRNALLMNTENEQALATLKSTLLDTLFSASLHKQLKKSGIKPPISEHYTNELSTMYQSNKAQMLSLSLGVIDATFERFIATFKKNRQADYILVFKGQEMLAKFKALVPKGRPEVKRYLDKITAQLLNEKSDINARAALVKKLPDDLLFNSYLGSMEGGPSFLTRFKQYIERICASLYLSILTGKGFFDTYNKRKLDQTIENIEVMATLT
ncbi:MAG: SdhB, partial [Legionellales bacterium]